VTIESSSLKIIFAGTPEFAAIALRELLKTSHDIVAVYTQPDRPAGRGRKLTASPVKELALQHHLPVYQPESLRDSKTQTELASLRADIMVVAAYGLLLPAEVLTAPRLGCINIHPSLLPRWRGAAPIQRSILAGDDMTGVCIMQMEEGLDTGPVLYRIEEPITALDTGGTMHDKLASLGANALVQTLNILLNNTITAQIQNPAAVTYASKFSKEDARIDWHDDVAAIDRKIRAFNPWPTAFTDINGQSFKVWQAGMRDRTTTEKLAGTILGITKDGIDVATGKGILTITSLHFAGGKKLTATEIFNASNSQDSIFKVGARLGEAQSAGLIDPEPRQPSA
jgi:methionyl-tRNA formyltransferase